MFRDESSVDELIASLERTKQDLESVVKAISSCISSLKFSNSDAGTVATALSDLQTHSPGLVSSGRELFKQEPSLEETTCTPFLRVSEQILAATASLGELQLQLDSSNDQSANGPETSTSAPPIAPVTTSSRIWPLEPAEYRRYARQLVMPEIGIDGQLRLKASSVLIIGAGGLGCPAAAYLSGAGVGTIGIVDGDVVEESNLHRQIMHDGTKVGMMKVDSVIEAMQKSVDVSPESCPQSLTTTLQNQLTAKVCRSSCSSDARKCSRDTQLVRCRPRLHRQSSYAVSCFRCLRTTKQALSVRLRTSY
jgi:hypothetical protein